MGEEEVHTGIGEETRRKKKIFGKPWPKWDNNIKMDVE
jgi:hypothetical protein